MAVNPEVELVPCDQCGRLYTFFELAETVEEYLCEWCASGCDPDGLDEHDFGGQEWGNEPTD